MLLNIMSTRWLFIESLVNLVYWLAFCNIHAGYFILHEILSISPSHLFFIMTFLLKTLLLIILLLCLLILFLRTLLIILFLYFILLSTIILLSIINLLSIIILLDNIVHLITYSTYALFPLLIIHNLNL